MSERRVSAQSPLLCSAAVARDLLINDPSSVLAPRSHPAVERRTFPMTLRMKSAASGTTTMQEVTIALGIPDTASGSRFPVTWSPTGHRRMLPSFRGHLELLANDDTDTIRVDGVYRPPFGRLGAFLDAVALHRAAQRSIQDLVEYTATRLAETAAERAESVAWHPAPAGELLRDRPPSVG